METLTPTYISFIACRASGTSESSGRCLTSVLSKLAFTKFPTAPEPMTFYFEMTHGLGKFTMYVRVMDAAMQKVIWENKTTEQEFKTPTEENVYTMPALVEFPAPGTYVVSLWVNDKLVVCRRLEAHWQRGIN